MTEPITLRPQDLFIATYHDRETNEEKPILRIASHLAFDQQFIEEMEEKGVKRLIKRNESGEDEAEDSE